MLGPVVSRLPKMPGGFRPGKDVPFRIRKFFARLGRWDDDDWQLMCELWCLWTRSQSHLYEALGSPSSEELERLVREANQSRERLHELIGGLVVAARAGSVDQESIREWYELGPLPSDPIASMLIALAPTKEEKAWLARLRAMEDRFPVLEHSLQQAMEDSRSLQDLPQTVAELANERLALRMEVEALGKGLGISRVFESEAREALGNIGRKVDTLLHQDVELGVRLNAVELRVQELESCRESAFDPAGILTQQEEIRQSIQLLSGELDRLRTIISGLESHLVIETRQVGGTDHLPQILVTPHVEPNLSTSEFQDCGSIIKHLEQNLFDLGLQRKQSRRLAVDVLTAALTGQMIVFSGSMAFTSAMRCAYSLSGNQVYVLRVPVGLWDSSGFDRSFQEIVDTARASGGTAAVIIEGINRSALEVYGSYLRELICNRALGLQDLESPLIILGTVVHGSSAIPYGKELLELGPVFDTDSLGWTYRSARYADPGVILPQVWSERANPEISPYWEGEILPQEVSVEAGPLWRRMVSLAYHVHEEIDPSVDLPPAARLSFGWVLPMALHLRLELPEEILSQYREDDRCHLMLRRLSEGRITSCN